MPKSKKQLALRAELMRISDLSILLFKNEDKLYTFYSFLIAIGDSFLCFPVSPVKRPGLIISGKHKEKINSALFAPLR